MNSYTRHRITLCAHRFRRRLPATSPLERTATSWATAWERVGRPRHGTQSPARSRTTWGVAKLLRSWERVVKLLGELLTCRGDAAGDWVARAAPSCCRHMSLATACAVAARRVEKRFGAGVNFAVSSGMETSSVSPDAFVSRLRAPNSTRSSDDITTQSRVLELRRCVDIWLPARHHPASYSTNRVSRR